ncbi:MAG: ATP-dependent Clp protease proteolytic subunit, partial [Phycisphaerales bacterium]
MIHAWRWTGFLLLATLAAALLACATPAVAQSTGVAIPAGRAAKNVAIITMQGEINGTMAASIKRRLNEAVEGKADAVVIEIDSPGGELGAVFDICTSIKQCPIANTVAWVRPMAYSGGAIVALACREIVVAEACSFGDAAPIEIRFHAMVRTMGRSERAKILAPLLAELIDSARLRGYDEKLVQGFAMLGVELWLIENTKTGEKLFIDRAEFVRIYETEPPLLTPTLTGGPPGGPAPGRARSPSSPGNPGDAPTAVAPPSTEPTGDAGTVTPAETGTTGAGTAAEGEPTFVPASNQSSPQLVKDLNLNLSGVSTRPVITAAAKAEWRVVEYVSNGDS